jgi:hypothetical protein
VVRDIEELSEVWETQDICQDRLEKYTVGELDPQSRSANPRHFEYMAILAAEVNCNGGKIGWADGKAHRRPDPIRHHESDATHGLETEGLGQTRGDAHQHGGGLPELRREEIEGLAQCCSYGNRVIETVG